MRPVIQRETYVKDYSARIDPNYFSYSLAPAGAVVLPVGEEGPTSASAPQGSIQQVDAGPTSAPKAASAAEPTTGVDLSATATSQALAAVGGEADAPPATAIPETPEGLPVTTSVQGRPVGVGNPFAADFVDAPPGAAGPGAATSDPRAHPIAGFTSTMAQELGPPPAKSTSKSGSKSKGASSAPRSHPIQSKSKTLPRLQDKGMTRAQHDRLMQAENPFAAHVERQQRGRNKRP